MNIISNGGSCCVWVVVPDDHLANRYHEILIHDMEDEKPPFVAFSELGCLRLDWPKALFTFMARYQFDLDQMCKECRERFGSTQSGVCATCGKHIQQNLGKHIALCHLELAQLWRCPVSWCTVWKGTSQDCVDHMRKTHDIPTPVKAANLARWFPPWTATRDQWTSMMRPTVSGIAVDTLLFSRIGVPFTGIRFLIGMVRMPHSVVRTCIGCILFWRNLMRRRCVLVIADALWRLQLGCCGQHCRIQVIERLISLLELVRLVNLDRGSGSLPLRRLLLSHQWLREPLVLVVLIKGPFRL